MSTAYLPILESLTSRPTAYRFPSDYDARIADVCIVEAARRRGMDDVVTIRQGRVLVLWRGDDGLIGWPLRPRTVKALPLEK